MAPGQRKQKAQWTADERKAANLDQRLKSLIMSVLPDDQMNSVINCLTTKSTWDDLILYHEGPSDDFQDSPDDEEDTRSSHEYLNDLEEKYQAKALLAKSKRFFKKGTQRNTKYCEAKYNKVKAKPALLSSSASAPSSFSSKNKGFIVKSHDWDEEEVSSDDEETKVKAFMALTDKERIYVRKESARNGEWTKITIKSNLHKSSEAEDSTLPNHDTDEVPSNKSQRNTTDPSAVVSDSPTPDYDLADKSSVCSTPFLPLKKLDGAEHGSGPKIVKSILKSKSTFKAETIKGITLNEPSSTPARGNKSSLASKTNSAPAGKLKNVNMEDDPPLAMVIKELNELKLKINHTLAICALDKLVVFKAPKTSSRAESVSQGVNPGAKTGHKKPTTSFKQPFMSSKEVTKRVTSEERADPQLSSDFTAKADHGLYAPNDFIPLQQGMNEGTDPHVLADQTKSVSEGLETVLTQPTTEKRASFTTIHGDKEEASNTIKLEDLTKLVSQIQPSFKDLDSPEDDLVIIVDESDEDEPNSETKDTSVPRSSSLRSSQIQELTNKVLILYSLPTELKDLLSKFNELTKEIKGLKTQGHELELELLEEFLSLPAKVESAQAKLKTLDALLSLLLNVTKALNKFAKILERADKIAEAKKENMNQQPKSTTPPTTTPINPPIITTTTQMQTPLQSPPRSFSQPEGEHIKKGKGKKVMSLEEAEKESSESDFDEEAHMTGSIVKSSKEKKLKKFDFVTEDGRYIYLSEEQINNKKNLDEEAKAEAAK
uniref:Retrovirus-related Pol polyprotein from transposon TNT 1-94 n=1 Tax=Tanacetum cinerariifolium TaxID=118510 RepID=A0A6L2J7H3_TANCI|nr:retrovirus-related Pol polyprotein from transposon TNT 1-94 [Tanacetum cinerariifolium]